MNVFGNEIEAAAVIAERDEALAMVERWKAKCGVVSAERDFADERVKAAIHELGGLVIGGLGDA
jgi:hypothetical protein